MIRKAPGENSGVNSESLAALRSYTEELTKQDLVNLASTVAREKPCWSGFGKFNSDSDLNEFLHTVGELGLATLAEPKIPGENYTPFPDEEITDAMAEIYFFDPEVRDFSVVKEVIGLDEEDDDFHRAQGRMYGFPQNTIDFYDGNEDTLPANISASGEFSNLIRSKDEKLVEVMINYDIPGTEESVREARDTARARYSALEHFEHEYGVDFTSLVDDCYIKESS